MKTGTLVVFNQNWVDNRFLEIITNDYTRWLVTNRYNVFELFEESKSFPEHFHIKEHPWCFHLDAFIQKSFDIFSNDDFLI